MSATSAAFRILIASGPDRDDLVAEVWLGEDLFAELCHEAGGVSVQLYSPPTAGPWDVRLADLLAVLDRAQGCLGPASEGGIGGDLEGR